MMSTDLGIAFEYRGRLRFVFGDTYGFHPQDGNVRLGKREPGGPDWRFTCVSLLLHVPTFMCRSNVMAVANDFRDPGAGLALVDWTLRPNGTAAELIPSLKRDNVEVTSIPTAAWAVSYRCVCVCVCVCVCICVCVLALFRMTSG